MFGVTVNCKSLISLRNSIMWQLTNKMCQLIQSLTTGYSSCDVMKLHDKQLQFTVHLYTLYKCMLVRRYRTAKVYVFLQQKLEVRVQFQAEKLKEKMRENVKTQHFYLNHKHKHHTK